MVDIGLFSFYGGFSQAWAILNDVNIEDITRWRKDMNFIFEWQNNNIVFATRK